MEQHPLTSELALIYFECSSRRHCVHNEHTLDAPNERNQKITMDALCAHVYSAYCVMYVRMNAFVHEYKSTGRWNFDMKGKKNAGRTIKQQQEKRRRRRRRGRKKYGNNGGGSWLECALETSE